MVWMKRAITPLILSSTSALVTSCNALDISIMADWHIESQSSSTSTADRSSGVFLIVAFSTIAKPAIPSNSSLRLVPPSSTNVTDAGIRSSFCCLRVAAYSARNLSVWPRALCICKHSNKGVKSTWTSSLSKMSNSSVSSETSSIAELSLNWLR